MLAAAIPARPRRRVTGMRSDLAALLKDAFAHHQGGQVDAAEALYRKILEVAPAHADALHLLGLIRMEAGAYPEAIALIRTALQQAPRHPVLLNNLAECLRRAGDLAAARPLLEQALTVQPAYAEAHHNLGKILAAEGNYVEAIAAYHRALAGMPAAVQVWLDLAEALQRLRQPDQALAAYRQAWAVAPDSAAAANLLAMTLKNGGRIDEACEVYETFLTAHPDDLLVSNYLLTSCYLPDLSPTELRARHEAWVARLPRLSPRKEPASASPGPDDRDPSAPMTIGFVSGDFRIHALRFFIEPLLRGLRTSGVRLVGYHNHDKPDLGTDELRPFFDVFRQVDQQSDAELVRCIQDDGVDVLVDLTGHTGHHRLAVFAARPAPLQVSWIGYLATTGLDCFDAHLTDRVALPEHTSAWFTEPLAYLPHCQWCYQSPQVAWEADARAAAPAGVVFGGLHMPSKLNAQVLDAWAQILRQCPDATLLLMGDDLHEAVAQLVRRLPSLAEASHRVRCLPAGSLNEYLRAHRQIDLMLDAFPYTGGTTTFHSLAMGVPVLTCATDHPAGRGGASILSAIGLAEFVTESPADYIAAATGWAGRVDALRARRADVRRQLLASPVTDADGFAAAFLATVRALWRERYPRTPD